MYYLLNLIKFSVKKTITEKILENGEKYWKSQGKVREFCQSGKVGTLVDFVRTIHMGFLNHKRHFTDVVVLLK